MEQKELLKKMWDWANEEQPNLKEMAYVNNKEMISYYENTKPWETVVGDYYQVVAPESMENEILLLETDEIADAFDRATDADDFISKISKSWYNNGIENKQFYVAPDGWKKGRIFKNRVGCPKGTKLKLSDEERKARSERRAERNKTNPNHPWLGKHLSDDMKKKIADSHKGKPAWNKGVSPSDEAIEKMKATKKVKYEKKLKEREAVCFTNNYITSDMAAKLLRCGTTTFERYNRDNKVVIDGKNLYPLSCLVDSPLENMKAKGISHQENEIYTFIQSIYSGNIQKNIRSVISPLELDLYLPDAALAIEFDGLYWHSRTQDPQKHISKTLACENKNIRLLHIFEDEWRDKKEIVKSMIASALGIYQRKIYARDCEFRRVSAKEALDFINKNHIMETRKTVKDCFGLYYNDELVQVATFRKNFAQRKNKELELARMCSSLNNQVIGGFSKLIKHSLQELNETSVTSFVDRRLFDCKGYTSSGWKLLGASAPKYFYTDFEHRYNRQEYMKQSCLKKWPDADKTKTEKEICNMHGLFQIYDCGCFKVKFDL